MPRRDFTVDLLCKLLIETQKAGYESVTYSDYMNKRQSGKLLVLRHDIDASPVNALRIAELENALGIKGSYYIRMKPRLYDKSIVRKIVAFGHEIGYHYENLSTCKGNYEEAWEDFRENLGRLRDDYPVDTICMHGSPLSRYDNKDLWKRYNYRELGICAELYLDTDFADMGYLTDTGRAWNSRFRIRDRVDTPYCFEVKDSFSLIQCFQQCELPSKIMITLHPQRWSDNYYDWFREMLFQQFKNFFKMALWKSRKLYDERRTVYHY